MSCTIAGAGAGDPRDVQREDRGRPAGAGKQAGGGGKRLSGLMKEALGSQPYFLLPIAWEWGGRQVSNMTCSNAQRGGGGVTNELCK